MDLNRRENKDRGHGRGKGLNTTSTVRTTVVCLGDVKETQMDRAVSE